MIRNSKPKHGEVSWQRKPAVALQVWTKKDPELASEAGGTGGERSHGGPSERDEGSNSRSER
jgi:general stress protein YciG